ncbi:bifunctional transcriptional activator/DNA repair enzyme protein Ada [Bacillus canaveralius]|uniref:methylated-DNA--[protein]-cysteine S-methyltransferase n=1 Tax=Bacillus canaveralius TaxID=1403243 RepID=A0A2N5GQR8_9BACI|nr:MULTISPECIES: trifunctional transcriptional activator/DNA repair protein Ada/methylated-DNA--[protein]-cysteine S-methyltransferase [Bacillus]PLR85583.1 bifunctional transcriptional activator/DNA repair enzyme protein Ada [Bacillus canaveralius]PLR86421.1 bifunctional transcriptional activator/DNA repair enzyme protein Ada [Bacillus sp. V33-4]PLR94756.1 bifunctional transcriptional activator/DNA repair enzyme protein Ada [Bacillus canaveralius]
MITADKREYYQALIDKNTEYEGVFYVGVKTTGVFCRPTCPARKPKFENCEFFENAQQALLASYRPCKRCRPLSHPNQVSELVQKLVEAVEDNPEKRWKDKDFRELSVDASTARRQFKKRFGMTFVEYARARRMGLAMKQIREGEAVIDAQLSTGYESSSGFRDAFSRIMGAAPTMLGYNNILKAAWLDTKLGPMIAIADEESLYLLEFVDRRGLEREVERLRQKTKSAIIPGQTEPIQSIKSELDQYFDGKLTEFKTPLFFLGSPFQRGVWEQLRKIPYGQTISYSGLAAAVGKPSAFRAAANANGANQLAIIIPCHRVINTNGELGGYAGGLTRKKWLINHEAKAIIEHNSAE